MVIDFGKSKIFKWQMTQTVYGVVGRDFAPAHLLEQFANGFSVHVRLRRMALRGPSGGL
jgi:hypothetical protein